jgi:MFS family permease
MPESEAGMKFRLIPSRAVRTRPLLLCYAMCMAIFVASVSLNTVLPFRLTELGANRMQIGLMFSLLTVVSLVLRPAVGGWIDVVGARPVLFTGIAILAAVSLVLDMPRDPWTVIALTAGIGVVNALVNTANSVLTARASDAAHRGEALSLFYVASSVGIGVAPPAALALRDWGGISFVFAAAAGLAFLLFLFTLLVPRALTTAVTSERPPFRIVSRHALRVSGPLALTTAGYSSMYAFLPLHVTAHGHQAAIGWFFATYSAAVIMSRLVFGPLLDKIGRARLAAPAMLLTAAGYLALTISAAPVSLVAAAVFLGAGSGILFPTLVALVLDRAPKSEHGVALGSIRSAWDFGVVLGSALIGAVAERVSFEAGFAAAAASATIGAVVFVLMEYRKFLPIGAR